MTNNDYVYTHNNNFIDNNMNNNQDNNINNQEDENPLIKIYELVDSIPLSRPKKNISRDFSDGVLVAEIVKYFKPSFVEIHNYPSKNNTKGKIENWNTLNRKVFKRFNFNLSNEDIKLIINYTPQCIENVLIRLFEGLVEVGVDIDKHLYEYQLKNEENKENQKLIQNQENVKYQQVEEEYKKHLIEKDEIINELKVAIEETNKNLKISEENKKILSHQLETLKKKIKELGIF